MKGWRSKRKGGGGEKEALYLHELAVAESTDWYNAAARPLVVSWLSPHSTIKRNELMQDWIEIDLAEGEKESERQPRRELANCGTQR